MGNWRRVRIVGTCAPAEVSALLEATAEPNLEDRSERREYHCLTRGSGIMGLHDWPAEHMDVTGCLAERDYTVDDVAARLTKLLAVAPSLTLRVHCGGDYESEECIATIVVGDGTVLVGNPEVSHVHPPSEAQVSENVQRAFLNARPVGAGHGGFDYRSEMAKLGRLVRLAATLEVDLDQLEEHHSYADSMAPFLDPTAWLRGGAKNLDEQRDLLGLAGPFVRGARELYQRVLAEKGGR